MSAPPPPPGPIPPGSPPTVVLDTHILLDWAVFGDPRTQVLRQAVVSGQLLWLGTASMKEEALVVVQRAHLQRWKEPALALEAIHGLWNLHARELPPAAPAPAGLRCRDPDDQKFADLACAQRATWLLSRDRALLALKRPLARQGVTVMSPEAWLVSAQGDPRFARGIA